MDIFTLPPKFGFRLLIRAGLCKLTYSLFSWRSRRMIFLSSIYGLVTEKENPDVSHVAQLTKVLNLAKDYRALAFPVAIKSVIWSKTDKNKVTIEQRQLCLKDLGRSDLSEKECDALAEHIVRQAPYLLKYAKTSQMVYDVKRLGFFLKNMSHPTLG